MSGVSVSLSLSAVANQKKVPRPPAPPKKTKQQTLFIIKDLTAATARGDYAAMRAALDAIESNLSRMALLAHVHTMYFFATLTKADLGVCIAYSFPYMPQPINSES